MSTLSNTKLLSGKTVSFGNSVDIFKADTGGILYDPKFYEGSFTYFNGEMYYSNGEDWVTTDPPVVRTPSALTPTTAIHNRQLRLSPFSTTDVLNPAKQVSVIFEISLKKDMSNPWVLTAVSDVANTYNLPTELYIGTTLLSPGTKYYWRGKYVATYLGGQIESGYSKPRDQVFPELIDKPSIVTTADAVVDTLIVSAFSSPFTTSANSTTISGSVKNSLGYLGVITWVSTEWEAYTTNDLSVLTIPGSTDFKSEFRVFDPYIDIIQDNTISAITAPTKIPNGDTYYWRARHNGNDAGTAGSPGKGYVNGPWTALQKNIQVDKIVTPKTVPDPWLPSQLLTQLVISQYKSAEDPEVPVQDTIWEIFTSVNTSGNPRYTVNAAGTRILETQTLRQISAFGEPALPVETPFFWRAKYVNQNNASSEYTSRIPLSFLIPNFINTPSLVTPNNSKVTRLQISDYITLYGKTYTRTEWEFYRMGSEGQQLTETNGRAFQELTTTDIDIKNTTSNLLGLPKLVAGTTYLWRARYVGVTFGTTTPVFNSDWSAFGRFIQDYNLEKPGITPLVNSTTYEGPTVTFTASTFAFKSGGLVESPVTSTWILEKQNPLLLTQWNEVDSRIYNYVTGDTLDKFQSWTSQKAEENSSFRVTVKYKGTVTESESSDFYYFKTALEYKNVIPNPDRYNIETGVNSLTIGEFYKGGYYSSDMWGYVCETVPKVISIPTNVRSTTAGYLNNIYIGLSPSVSFSARRQQVMDRANKDFQFTFELADDLGARYYQDVQGPLFYLGQVVDIRNKANPYQKMQGHIVRAYGNTITVGVYQSEITGGVSDTVTWCIMAKHRILVGDIATSILTSAADAYFEGALYNSKTDPAPAIPYEAFSFTEGQRATKAYYDTFAFSLPAKDPAAATSAFHLIKQFNGNSTVNKGYTDWYMPSRDELTLVSYYYVGNFNSTLFTSSTTSYKRGGNLGALSNLTYSMYGAFPYTSNDLMGTCRNSVTPLNEFNLDKLSSAQEAQYRLSNLPPNPVGTITPTSQKFYTAIAYSHYSCTTYQKGDGVVTYNSRLTSKTQYLANPIKPQPHDPVFSGYDYYQEIKLGGTATIGTWFTDDATAGAALFRLIRREIY